MKNNKIKIKKIVSTNDAIIYCRVSSERQKNEGHGLDSQEHRCSVYAKEKGYKVNKIFRDSYTGGGDFTLRPAMREMINYLDENDHKNFVVIFDDIKRLARDHIAYWRLKELLTKKLGAILESPNFEFGETEESWLHEAIAALFSDFERRSNKRQVKQKMKARLEKGYWPFYPPPGFKMLRDPDHGKILTPIEPEASIVKEAFEGFALGRFSLQVDVQKFLSEKQFLGKKKINLEQVKRLLSRPVYAGYIEYPDWEVERIIGKHKPIISKEIYEKVEEKLKGKVKTWTKILKRDDFPLRGIVLCSYCKKPFTSSWSKGRSKKYGFYRCNQPGCIYKNKSISKDKIEKEFNNLLINNPSSDSIFNYVYLNLIKRWNDRVSGIDKKIKLMEKEIDVIENKVDTYLDRIDRSSSNDMVILYECKIKELNQRNKQIVKDIIKLKMKVTKNGFETVLLLLFIILKNPLNEWSKANLSFKDIIYKLVFFEPLCYDPKSGFGTEIPYYSAKLFGLKRGSNSQGVEVVGVEPTCRKDSYISLHVYYVHLV